MKSFTSDFVFKDVVNGPGWTDEYSEKISQKPSIGKDSSNNSSIKASKTDPKA